MPQPPTDFPLFKYACKGCLDLGQEIWSPAFRSKHGVDLSRSPFNHVILSDILQDAEKDCKSCRVVLRILEPFMDQLMQQSKAFSLRFDKGLEIIVKSHEKTRIHRNTAATLDIRSSSPENHHPWSSIATATPISGDTGSSQAVARVRLWLDECLSTHKQCRSQISSQLPTRVLSIKGPTTVSLYQPEHEMAEYVCLSHCWGTASFLQTTERNLEHHLIQVPWAELPKTFQDAVSFTYALGIRYIWIDSLCIIQDSVKDWRHEGSKMSQIYDNAILTLSATRSSNPHEGCFFKCDKDYMPRFIEFKDTNSGTYMLYSQKELYPYKQEESRFLYPPYSPPLLQRGWVYQERLLSRRIVHFMALELWWECKQCERCECSSFELHHWKKDKFWNTIDPHSWEHKWPASRIERSDLQLEQSVVQMQECWEDIVTEYKTKSFTHPGDIFPALQGIAHFVPKYMGRYMAGLWEKTLVHGLCWQIWLERGEKPKQWRAPSWSWASVSNRVVWNSHLLSDSEACAKLCSAMTVPVGEDPTGQLTYGEVILYGQAVWGETREITKHRGGADVIVIVQTETSFWSFSPQWDVRFESKDVKRVLLVRLVVSSVWQYWILLRATDGCKGVYERCGNCTAYLDEYDDDDGETDYHGFETLYTNVAKGMKVKII